MNPNSKHEPRLKERLRAETAKAIAAAAGEIFASKGLEQARMEEIAARAGVSVGTLYNHFQDREALLRELVDVGKQELVHKLDALLEAGKREPFRAQLHRFARTVFDHFEAHREFLAITLQSDTTRLERPSEAMLEVKARTEALVQRGLDEGALRPLGHELWSTLLLGSVRAVLVHELRHPGKVRVAARADMIVEFFLRGAGA